MKMNFAAFAVLVGISLIGCGAPTVTEESEMVGENTQALCTVSATCGDGSTISCSGNTCAGQNGSSVTCDGVTTRCPIPQCNAGITCTQLKQWACNEGDEAECCASTGPQYCYCNPRGLWLCN